MSPQNIKAGVALNEEQAELIRDLLRGAIPVNPVQQLPSDFVTRQEFNVQISHLETKIAQEGLRTKLWVMAGCLSLMVAIGTSYVNLVSRIDRLVEKMPEVVNTLNERGNWMEKKNLQDAAQDSSLRRLDPQFHEGQ